MRPDHPANGPRADARRDSRVPPALGVGEPIAALGAPRLLTCKQAGEYTGLGERYMRRLIDEERITFVRIGGLVRFERTVLDTFIEAHRVPARRDNEVS